MTPEPPSTAMKPHILGIFAKEPVPGQVKTRLCPPLSPEEAADLYRVSLEETVSRFSGIFPLVLFYEGEEDYFRKTFPGVPLQRQGQGDLGERMAHALEHLFHLGYRTAALIGSDSPDLPLPLIHRSFEALAGSDAVTIPAADGGYILIGVRKVFPTFFKEIPWSTAGVLAATRRRAADMGLIYREIGTWEDLDDFISLRGLLSRSPESDTASFAAKTFAAYL